MHLLLEAVIEPVRGQLWKGAALPVFRPSLLIYCYKTCACTRHTLQKVTGESSIYYARGKGLYDDSKTQFSIKSLQCKEQKLMLASSRCSDSRAGKKKYDEEKKNGRKSFFLLVFPAYVLPFSPPSEHCTLLSECLELPTSKDMQLKMKKKSELPVGKQTVQDHSA